MRFALPGLGARSLPAHIDEFPVGVFQADAEPLFAGARQAQAETVRGLSGQCLHAGE